MTKVYRPISVRESAGYKYASLVHELSGFVADFGVKNIFTSSGFLREGSSHYHLLLTRAFLEVLWAGRTVGDDEIWKHLREPAAAMARAAGFLQRRDKLSLVGDVSPDFIPEFHKGVTAVGATG